MTNPAPSDQSSLESLRSNIEAIYLKRLPNPDTGLYDIKSSIDDLVALLTQEIDSARSEAEIGWKIELPDLPYFQIKAFDGHSEALASWVSPLYKTGDLPAQLSNPKGDL